MYTPEDVKKAVACFRYDWKYSGEAISTAGRRENLSVEELFAKILQKRTLVDNYVYWSGAHRSLVQAGIPFSSVGHFSNYKRGKIKDDAQLFLLSVFTELANGNVSQKLEDYL